MHLPKVTREMRLEHVSGLAGSYISEMCWHRRGPSPAGAMVVMQFLNKAPALALCNHQIQGQ